MICKLVAKLLLIHPRVKKNATGRLDDIGGYVS